MAHIAYSTQQRMASAFPKSLMFKGSEFEVYEEGEILDDGPERIPQHLNMITSTSMETLGSKYCRHFDNGWVKGSEAIQREGFGRFGSEAFQREGFGRLCVGESSGYANSREVGWNENFLPLSDSNFDTIAWAQAVRKRSYFHKDGLQAFAKRRRLEISSRGLNINVSKGIQHNLKGSSTHHAFSFGRNLSLVRKGLGNNYSQSYMLLDKNERTFCEMCRTVHSQASCSLMGPIYGNCEVKDEAITNIKGLNTGYLSFGVCLNRNQEMPEKGVRNEVGSVIGESKTLNHKVKVTGTLNMVKGTDRSSVVIPDCNINATSSSKIKFALKHFPLLVSDCNSDASCTMNTDKIVQRNDLKEVDHKDIPTQKERIGISSSLTKPSSCKQESTIRSLSENDKSRIEEWHSKFQARRLQKKVERGLCYLKIRQKKQFSNLQASQQKLGCSSLAEEFLAGAVNADRSLVEVFQKLCKFLLVFEEICSSESTVWKGLWDMIHAKLSIAVYHTFYEIQLLFKAQEITTEKEQQLNEETLRKVLELAYDFCEKLLRLKQIPELECTMQIIQGILGNAEFVGSSKQGQVFILMQSLIKDILQEIESQMEGLSTSIAIDTMPIENSKSEDSVKSEVFTSSGADEDIAEPDLPKDAPAISTAIPQSHKSIGSLSGMAFESARNSCSTADLKLDSSSISLDQTVSVELASHGGHSGHVNEQLFSILAVPNQKFQVNKSARFSKKKSPDAQDSKDFCFSIKPVMHILDVKHEELHLLELHNISDRGRSRKIFELTEGLDKASISVLQNSSSKTEATCDMKKENIAENNASINNSDIHHHMDIELCKDDRSAKSFETRKDSHLFKDGLKESSDTPLDNDAQRLEASLEKRALPIDSHLKVKRASSDSKKTPLPSLEHNYINQGGALLNNRAAPFLEQIPSSMSQSGMRSDVQKLCLSSNFLLSVDLADFDSHSCTSFSCTEVDDAKSSTRVEYSYNQRLSDEESSDSQQRGDCYKTSTADLPLEDPYKNKKLFWKQDFQRRSLEQDRMLHAGKLCLVLDLDHTLLNSAKFSEIEPEWKHKLCAIQSKYRSRHGNGVRKRELHCCTNLGMWTKLRPGIWRFLAKASELYELHLYTMGNKVYATQMAKLLDPTGELFAGRIISKGDDGNDKQAKSKNLNGVPGMESAVLIVDDSARVWPFHRKNLIGVERYMYFPCTRRQFGLPGPSLLEAGRDEREVDGMLLSTLAVLTKIHKAFFERCPLGERPDVRGLLAAEQQRILQGCGIVFSRVFPLGESQPQLHPLWQLAEQFGAKCSTSTDNSTTHIVAVSLGTDKIRWARANGRYVVNPQWLEASAVLYRRANEKHFPVTAHPRASAVLYRRSNEQQFPGTSPDRIDQRASSTTI